MSYSSWQIDIGRECDSALRLAMGQELGEHDITPDRRVVAGIAEIATEYDRHYDRDMVEIMCNDLADFALDAPDGERNLVGFAKRRFRGRMLKGHFDDSAMFRWFMVHAKDLDLGIADADAIRTAYIAYWADQFDRIALFITRHAIVRDNEDDRYYEVEAQGEFDELYEAYDEDV